MNKIALCINVCADDWTTERMIIASNVLNNLTRRGPPLGLALPYEKSLFVMVMPIVMK